MSENIIVVEDAVKEFKENTVLDHISVRFEKGKIHGIIGRNGSGKTVLFKCICGFVPLSSGRITVNGQVIGKDVDIPGNVGAIIEAPGFLPNYSGFNNLKLLALIKNKIGDKQITDAITQVGLDPKSRKWVSKYSLGMRQRLGIAQAIMEDPEIMILDEPMNGLDNQGVRDIRDLLLKMRESQKTILLASHSKEDISILCDDVYEIDRGKIISSSTNGTP